MPLRLYIDPISKRNVVMFQRHCRLCVYVDGWSIFMITWHRQFVEHFCASVPFFFCLSLCRHCIIPISRLMVVVVMVCVCTDLNMLINHVNKDMKHLKRIRIERWCYAQQRRLGHVTVNVMQLATFQWLQFFNNIHTLRELSTINWIDPSRPGTLCSLPDAYLPL